MKKNIPNIISIGRVVLSFITLFLLDQAEFITTLIACIFIVLIIFTDFLDGFLARKFGVESSIGAVLDIMGDRIVEFIFWIFYASKGLLSFWFPVIVISRDVIVDTVRQSAFSQGIKPYEIHNNKISKFIVTSGYFRTGYALSKAAAFTLLGIDLLTIHGELNFNIHGTALAFSWIALIICIVRGLPVVVEAWPYLKNK
ncbi:MAG TPA: CDP-alcohol phosphatidyltransferase family protein [Candidatus Hydrothermia bacterium]|nr:CDP-alcohol phosphatidyltransferase family protein [Candidatus Hydrothermia bacterium]HOK23526.1 CDP-alcohol phosphatidyltransferase family protein [Candidatus Hydrothermia bacterium]HOL24245.1 CDP-alcohol phosphatidyltransferase family protein [Candidatus Hydrothermia bacterium]HPO79184.1 CDP-alcohol phosphatidyltransferase family protein [Candidatus Hydrothermia bacterium]HRD22881.1 CDP-alcohol phosphatidyltransferase family protein [Candidatus Hydrothermia bacterium]